MTRYASCILLVEKNKFLAVSRKEDHDDFNLPGGSVEEGESCLQAAIRELKEETGLEVTMENLTCLHVDKDGVFRVYTYYCHEFSGDIHTVENHKVKWLPLEDLRKSKLWPRYNSMVLDKYNNVMRDKQS